MCCETCRQGAVEGAHSPSPDFFYASLLDAMHAMAQPLTLLSSHFYLAGPATGPVSEQLQNDAVRGLEYLCTLFRLMQELVHVQSSPAQPAVVPAEVILDSLEADAEAIFAGSGHRFALCRPAPGATAAVAPEKPWRTGLPPASMPRLTADPKRTRLALVSMLHLARAGAHPGSAVSCHCDFDARWLRLRLRPEQVSGSALEGSFDEVTRLHLALARANTLGQGAVFCLATQPFALVLELPVQGFPG